MNIPNSVILTQSDVDALKQMIGYTFKLELLYRASRDGKTASAFHLRCDNKSPTITVAKLSTHTIGGYTEIPWTSAGGVYLPDNSAFIFRLAPTLLKVPKGANNPNHGVYHHSGFGPTFGGGHDLYFSGAVNGTSYSNLGHSYTPQPGGANSLVGTRNNWVFQDLEVFSVSKTAIDLASSYLSPSWNADVAELKNYITNYTPSKAEKLGVNVTNIMFWGGAGAGKSSSINGAFGAMKGRPVNRAIVGGNDAHVTKKYSPYTLDNNMKITIWDTMGFSLSNYKGAALEFMLDGLLLPNFDLTGEPVFGKAGTRTNPTINHRVHSIVLFIPALEVSEKDYLSRISEFVARSRTRSLQVLLVLTQIDEYVVELKDPSNYKDIFKCSVITSLTDKIAQETGLPQASILPLINHYRSPPPNVYLDYLILSVIQRALYNADDYFDEIYQETISSNLFNNNNNNTANK